MKAHRLSGFKALLFTTALSATVVLSCQAMAEESVTGAGSTFIYPAMSQWTTQYKKETGNEINYQSIGSGGGLRQLKQGTVDFAASDQPLTLKELKKKSYLQFPAISGGIVLAYHLPIKQTLTLDGKTTAEIFSGKIKFWDNAAIARLNPDIKLPHLPVISVHRSDGSGTTYNFTYYLSQVAPSIWTAGAGKLVAWPGAGLGGKGNAGVANYIKQISGSIGYVEYAYAKDNNIAAADMINRAGYRVSPSLSSFKASAQHAHWKPSNGFNLILANAPGKNSWPIAASTFILIRKNDNPSAIHSVQQFFKWVFTSPKAMKEATALDFITMPQHLVTQIEHTMKEQLNTEQVAAKIQPAKSSY